MGGGFYSTSASVTRKMDSGVYDTKSVTQAFKKRSLDTAMNPHGLAFREARDSEEHPNSLPIIIGLDVTGSMGMVPHELVKDGLNKIMGNVIQNGIPDPQVLFLGIGDHECDRAPLQVGQFESSDELCDKWLEDIYIERGGGGNSGESYLLAWYTAGRYTRTDQFEKRGKKGFLFTIGDEPTLEYLPKEAQEEIMGNGEYETVTAEELITEASKMYDVYHITIGNTFSGSKPHVREGWTQLLKENAIFLEHSDDVPTTIARIIAEREIDGDVVIKNNISDLTDAETDTVAVDSEDVGFVD